METYARIIYSGLLGDFTVGKDFSKPMFYGIWIGGLVLCAVIAYFLGCFNFGIILSKAKYNEDIRTKGSGNAGATNMLRTYGKKMAIATFAGDFLKSAVSVLIGIAAFGGIGGYIAAFGCMLGHAFPCFYGFKGGKGVAVSAGAILFLDWRVFIILFAFFAVIVLTTKFVSLGSVTCLLLFPVILKYVNEWNLFSDEFGRMPQGVVIVAILMALLVTFLHRENLKRIYNGNESKLNLGSKKKKKSGIRDRNRG